MYTLADAINPETGWGLAGETWRVMESLRHLGGVTWFNLGDRDLATHCYRTQRLGEGATLGEVTAELARRGGSASTWCRSPTIPSAPASSWSTGPRWVPGVLRPPAPRRGGGRRPVRGRRSARPGPGVLDALAQAEAVVVCPSNPVVSIGPLLAVPGSSRQLTHGAT